MTITAPASRALLLLTLLGGCAVGPDYRPPSAGDLKLPQSFGAARPQTVGEVDVARWWAAFGDPVLTGLVERGLAANLDIDAAGARLRQARASLRSARGGLLPSASVSGSASRSIGRDSNSVFDPTTGQVIGTSGGDTTIFRGSFDAAYEADIFGGIRRSVEAARAGAQASEADLRDVQITVASEIALNYLDARLAQARLAIAERNLASQDETVEIVGWRVQAGLVSSLDLEQARQLRAQTAASIPALRTSYVAAVNRIAVLLGEAPGAVTATIDPVRAVPIAPAALSAAIPADMLQRRPDIASAERTLAAETARIGVETAQLYPALRLSGTFGGSATNIGDVLSSSIGNLVAGITAPIFQGGQIRAAIEGQRASTDAALAAYRSAVLLALEEVENALQSLTAAEQREQALIVADEAARNAVILARSQYRAGLIDFQALLESERSLLSSEDNRATARANRATATVQLYKALGGGWEGAPMPATALSSAERAAATMTRP
ncbi:RND transporter [Sphingomonas oleivorans]|uniref:RND transporter n=1 Tax=Sphingomonas oleivorans TaxID=1735121 RepID=A0A2T5FV03_9SPHN|nr:efflux transporter outer membrane subunit [Sphingomonas oleivorans]PTQ08554.1 RND transporter [Sphingomonas oleivorans]